MRSNCVCLWIGVTVPMIQRFPKVLSALSVAALLSACGDSRSTRTDPDPGGKLRVMVSVPPQADFVRRVGGEHVVVDVLVGDGQDPHTFSPAPAQMKALSRAQIFFTVGMPFEAPLAAKIAEANRTITLVDTSSGIEKIALECEHPHHGEAGDHPEPDAGDEPEHGGDDHDHEEGHHDHGEEHHHEDDPHIWLAPNLIKIQARHIADALSAAAPAHRSDFEENLSTFSAELDTLHAELAEKTKPFIGETFFVFHPAFGYFGHTYGIEQAAIEVGGNSPTPKELAAFIADAKEKDVKVLFVQPQFDSRSAEVVAGQLGAGVVSLDPLAPDVLANLRAIADAITAGLGGAPGGSGR